ncbi:isoprenylcysteine carboxyl methyltransferase family protein [Neobacillus sp. D3-1R]|uniref:isoprenylcysteine carboxyl methyltransferase family protein n=1 Tax=Neobacillus sp. D3-1R TaxID=3445778 RepID=UPI003FA188B8
MKVFFLFLVIIILQRLLELIVAKGNEKWMKKQGGIEYGRNHYRFIVGIHSFFFLFFIWEVIYFQKNISAIWPILLLFFVLTQVGRVWALSSLGRYWNTKIIVVPDAEVVVKGPYKYVKHPNYVIVTLEFLIIPLFYQAYLTMFVFSLLNVWILSIRIPEEEKALKEWTPYGATFEKSPRFFPKI